MCTSSVEECQAASVLRAQRQVSVFGPCKATVGIYPEMLQGVTGTAVSCQPFSAPNRISALQMLPGPRMSHSTCKAHQKVLRRLSKANPLVAGISQPASQMDV